MKKPRMAWAAGLLAMATLAVALASVRGTGEAVRLNDENYTQLRDHIRPTPAEMNWKEIPWRITFWDAVTEAQKRDRPVLAWMMNGHPLACT